MNDLKLLELAAKAAGIRIERGRYGLVLQQTLSKERRMGSIWNPLSDDGDALRLAVKLELDMTRFDDHDIRVTGRSPAHGTPGKHFSMSQSINGDPYAATRRAIVLAAAEIGKAME